MDGGPAAVLIAGPTASGKSALAVDLARRTGGVVINADSCQVYRELSIISARPSPQDEGAVPHRLYGYRTAAVACSVAEWLQDVADALAHARDARQLPIIVGGTGLYLRALTEGLAAIPDIPAGIRAHWRDRAAHEPAEHLHAELARRDSVMAERLRPGDSQRIARALEVIEATGRSLADWQADPTAAPLLPAAQTLRLVLEPERVLLHTRINRRFEAMVAGGALDEARGFAALGLDPALPAARAIGVRPLILAASGDLDLAAAIARGQAESRQYAKRQSTWFRNQMPDWRRVASAEDGLAMVLHALGGEATGSAG